MRARSALLVCAVTLYFLDIGAMSPHHAEAIQPTSTQSDADGEAPVVCDTACHAYTPPAVLLRSAWAGTLEIGAPAHASLDAADYDGDGDVDLVIGNFTAGREMPAWVVVWENLTKQRKPGA